MIRHIASLRGINISGKNKISMSELKTALGEKGFADVKTYLNSGNVIFSDDETDAIKLAESIRAIIFETFHLEIPVFVISQDELKGLLSKAPSWWGSGSKDIYDNLIFAIAPHSIETVAEKIGEPSAELEKVQICGNAAFWSFDRKLYAKANWWKKTATPGIGKIVTIRTANTLRKIAEM
ncbi:MAG: DUF1697 domain-containing protein [Treponema sp.]|nr:DUF1697 domain-containing protein [Spirochaetia bacterium]MDY4767925.1 DUF1697 domain-containing protein [Treponema sp.]